MTGMLKTLRETQKALHDALKACNEAEAMSAADYVAGLKANQAAVDAIQQAERDAEQPSGMDFTFRGPNDAGRYEPLYRLAEKGVWRACYTVTGEFASAETPAEAELIAARNLLAAVREQMTLRFTP